MKVLAALALIQVVIGAAIVRDDCDGICTDDWTPMCGTNSKTYSNMCELNRATCKDSTVTLGNPGACSWKRAACSPFCITLYAPVCGSDGKTYSNKCQLDFAECISDVSTTITISHQGACVSDLLLSK